MQVSSGWAAPAPSTLGWVWAQLLAVEHSPSSSDVQNPRSPRGICLQSLFSLTGQEPMKVLGVTLGVGLALLILVGFGYTFIRWCQRGQCWCREYGQCGSGM